MNQKGFTIPELVVTTAVFSLLMGFLFINLFQSQNKAAIHAALNTLVSDIRQQQIKTMAGDTQGTGTITNYGIYFQPGSYTLFHNTAYSSSDPSNFTITLASNVRFMNDLFPNTTLLFDKGNGEMLNFVNGSNAITIQDTSSNETRTITVNRYGVITQVH